MKDDGTLIALSVVGVAAAASMALGRKGSSAKEYKYSSPVPPVVTKPRVPSWIYFKDGKYLGGSGDRVDGEWDRAEWWYVPYREDLLHDGPSQTYVYVTRSNPRSPIHEYEGMPEGVIPDWVRQMVKRHPPK